MRASKPVIAIIVVMLSAALIFTSAFADTELPQQPGSSLPEAGLPGQEGSIPDLFTPLPYHPFSMGGNVAVDVTVLIPYYPMDNMVVYNRKPTFYFSRNLSATNYRIRVTNQKTGVVLYKYANPGICTATYCKITPPTKLNVSALDSNEGYYKWSVQAYVGGVWQPYSSKAKFYVYSPGFVSEFNDTAPSWYSHPGALWYIGDNWLYTNGSQNYWSSVARPQLFQDFTYSARIKRLIEAGSSNSMIVWGNPTQVTNVNLWYDGILFQYTNDNYYSIWKLAGGTATAIKNWTVAPAGWINPYDWNILTIVTEFPYLHFYINGNYLGYYDGESTGSGVVGLAMFKDGTAGSNTYMVDWAMLTSGYMEILGGAALDPAMELGGEPAAEGQVPWQSPGE